MSIVKNKFAFLIIIIGFFYLLPLYSNSLIATHDGESLIVKGAALYKALAEAQIPPRWAGDMNYSFGAPVLNNYYPLLGYLLSTLYALGIGFENSYKTLLGFSFILSGITFYKYISLIIKREAAFAGGVIYMLLPYHFLDIFVRGHLGELLALSIAPLVFYFLEKVKEKQSVLYILLGGITFSLLILSHNILALLFTLICFTYIIVLRKTFLGVVRNLMTLLLGLSVSVYFWLPALYESKYINSQLFVHNYFTDHFLKFENLVYAPWGFGVNINELGGLAPQIGIVPTLLAIMSLYALKFKKTRIIIIFWVAVFVISVFFTNELSSFVWSRIHILEQFQFPWRFVAITSFASAVLSAYLLSLFKKELYIYIVVAAVLISSTFYMQVAGFVKKTDDYYFNYPGTGAFHGEATTIWTAGDESSYPVFPAEIIAGGGEISKYERKSNLHTISVKADNDIVIKDNTVYYPGWVVEVGGKEVPVQFQDPNHRGYITFEVPKGSHQVKVKFVETALRLFADLVSIAAVLFTMLLFLYRKKIDKLINKK